ncbi:MAG: flagellar filament capping protein FliD [Phycisphaeraceae bacterium]
MSGLPTQDLIDQLMEIEARPRQQIVARNEQLDAKREAFQSVNSALLSLFDGSSALTRPRTFQAHAATSSHEGVATATAGSTATPGSYSLTVAQLVSAQQTISGRSFSSLDSTLGAGTLSFQQHEASLTSDTALAQLNGGSGVERGHIRITDRSGATADIDLSRAMSVDNVLDAINSTLGVQVRASVDGDRIKLTDNTGQTASELIVENVGGRDTASDLGLAGTGTGSELIGQVVNRLGGDTRLGDLNDGNGVRFAREQDDFRITAGDGTTHDVSLDGVRTLDELFTRIDEATAGAIAAEVGGDGVSIRLVDPAAPGAGSQFEVTALNGSGAAEDLGILGADDGSGQIAGERIQAGLNSRLVKFLNAGAGADLGEISIENRAGVVTQIDLTGAASISEVINRINDAGGGVEASVNAAGNGLALRDTSGGSGSLVVGDVTGTAMVDLNLAGTHGASGANSGDLRYQFVSEGSRLDQMGVAAGQFRIQDSAGNRASFDTTEMTTLGHLIDAINASGSIDVLARINDNGDGLILEDTGPGSVAMQVTEIGSTSTAADLGILGQAASGGEAIDGGFRHSVEIEAGDTIEDLAAKINDAGIGVDASLMFDGSGYRLIISGQEAGKDAGFLFDDGGLDLRANNVAEAQDAVVFFGGADTASAIAVTSSRNRLEGAIPGATVNLHATSDQPVQITVDRDVDKVLENVNAFVERFNGLAERLDEVDHYDSETQERSILMSDPAIATLRRSLRDAVRNPAENVEGAYQRLSDVGIHIGGDGRLSVDEQQFNTAFNADPDAVRALFTTREAEVDETTEEETVTARGVGVRFREMLDRLTHPQFGRIEMSVNTLDRQQELNEQRIEAMNRQLESKRERLELQFLNMEKALVGMQSQAQSLMGLMNSRSSGGGGLFGRNNN